MFYVLAGSDGDSEGSWMWSNPFESKNPQMAAQKGWQNKARITHTLTHTKTCIHVCALLSLFLLFR